MHAREGVFMGIVDFISKKNSLKSLQSQGILSEKEYKNKFLFHADEYVKREYYNEYITQRLAEEFGMSYNEKTKRWCSEWNDNQRVVVELYQPKGTHRILMWGYNFDFIPDINKKGKLVWYRTDSSVKMHINDTWYNHIEYTSDKEWGFSEKEFYNPVKCPTFQYEIPEYTSDMDFALEYIKKVVEKNILLMREWLDRVKTIDDVIEVLNQRVLGDDILHISQMHYTRAFLYAKSKNILEAMSAIKQYYENREIPQMIIDKLNQIAGE